MVSDVLLRLTSSVLPSLRTACAVNQEMTISQLSLIFIRGSGEAGVGSTKPYHC